jgi:hypothetical protein
MVLSWWKPGFAPRPRPGRAGVRAGLFLDAKPAFQKAHDLSERFLVNRDGG